MINKRISRRFFAVLMMLVMTVGFLPAAPAAALADNGVNSPPTVVFGQETQTGVATPPSGDGSLPAVAYTVYAGGWFTDADGDALTYSVVSATYGTDDVSADVSISGGTITYTPAAAQAGSTVTIVVKASDGTADSTGNVTINVAVNPIPVGLLPTIGVAAESEVPKGNSSNGYVSDIYFKVSAGNTESIPEYIFDPSTTEYDIVLADNRTMSYFTITAPSFAEQDLYYSIYKDGTIIKMGSGNKAAEATLITAKDTAVATAPMIFNTTNFPVGETHTLSVIVGTREDDAYTSSDVYNYDVTRCLVLKKFELKDGSSKLTLYPSFNANNNAYTYTYTAVSSAAVLTLTADPATSGAKLYVGENEFTSGSNITLSDYTEEDTDIAVIPFSLRHTVNDVSLRTNYTLYVSTTDYRPTITTQPTPMTVDKNTNCELTIAAEATGGTLSYQWYRGNAKIAGATSNSYAPPTLYAGTKNYKCVVTNTIGDIRFDTISDSVAFTVNLSELTAPEFTQQPQTTIGTRIFYENSTPVIELRVIADEYGNPIEGAPYIFSLYRNAINSTSSGTQVECEVERIFVGSSNTSYQLTMPSQSVTGVWYYYVVVSVSAEGYETKSRASDTLALTFKSATDVVTDLEGSGSAESPFLIYDVDDLLYVKGLVEGKSGTAYNFSGQTLAFADDISLPTDWKPIGNLKAGTSEPNEGVSLQPFSGTIDGKGHTLTVANHGLSLLNYARLATVKNLNIYGEHIDGFGLVESYVVDYGWNGSYYYNTSAFRTITIKNVTIKSGTNVLKSGFIGGFASGVNTVIVRNCIVEDGVVIGYDKSQGRIGSFAGDFNGIIENSVSYATVYGVNFVGGLFGGKGQSMGLCDVRNSAFLGKVIATGDSVGGIAGAGYLGASGTPVVQIHNCYVAADITGNDRVGGILGDESSHYYYNDTGDEFGIYGANAVSDNHFYGTITATGQNVGGIIGYLNDFKKSKGEATNFYLDTCGATSGIGGFKIGEIIGGEKFSASATATDFADGTVLARLNNSSTSLKNWIQGDDYPVFSGAAVVTSIDVSGEYKTEYYIGDALDLTGIEITAYWSDGATSKLALSDVEVTGYDNTTRGVQTLTVTYGAATGQFTVTVLRRPSTDPGATNTITVYFTLLGAKIHNGNDTTQTLRGGNLETWIPQTSYTVDLNATVWDVLKTALDAKGWTYSNPSGNYVESITKDGVALGEFTNGELSGWMYSLNGTHPLLGVAEQFLENGDRIVFHYTDDYTKEEGSEKWGSSGDASLPSPNSPGASLAPKVEALNGVAAATLTASDLTAAIKDAKAKGSASIVIVPEITGEAKKVTVELPKSSLADLASETDAALTVETPVGSVTIPNEALAAIAEQASGGTVTVSLAAVDNAALTPAQREAVGDNPVYDITITSGGGSINDFGGNSITVSLPYTLKEDEDPSGVTVWYLNDAGQLEQMPCTYDPETGLAAFITAHLSYYVVGYVEYVQYVAAPVWTNPFSDVKTADWFYDSVAFAVQKGLFNGTSATTFSPNEPMTRAMLVTVLYRLEGEPSVTGANNSFSDVGSGQWYTDAVLWANAEGIATGYGGGLFGADDSVTRQQMAAILYRYASYKGYDVTAAADLAAYTDAREISAWARSAMQWANAEGLLTGRTASMLAPEGSATRAEVAAILQRFVEGFVE